MVGNMTKDKLTISGIVFVYSKFIIGIVIIFWPLNIIEPYNSIIKGIGALIILVSGVNVKFSNIFKDTTKPN